MTKADDITDSIPQLLRTLAPKLNGSMSECQFAKDLVSCSNLFNEVITGEGLCFSFNMLDAKKMYKEM